MKAPFSHPLFTYLLYHPRGDQELEDYAFHLQTTCKSARIK